MRMIEASISHRVAFHDTDAMGIVWHGNYYKYFEIARCHLKLKMGIDVHDLVKLGYGMPVVASSAQYLQPLRYADEVLLHAAVEDLFYPSLEIHYRITSTDGKIRYAKGKTKQVYVNLENHETCLAVPPNVEKVLKEAEARLGSLR